MSFLFTMLKGKLWIRDNELELIHYNFSASNRLLSDVSLPILRELVPHYLQESGKVCFLILCFSVPP
jgi:hypothetical protein